MPVDLIEAALTNWPAILAILAAGGLVKGLVGIGLPLVTVPLLSLFMPIPNAVAAMSVPILVSNLYQTRQGFDFRPLLKRFGLTFSALAIGVAFGTHLLVSLDPEVLNIALGATVVAFACFSLFSPRFSIPRPREAWLGPSVGLGAGLLGGFSSFFGPPMIAYLVALRLPKDLFVAVVAMMFLSGALPLYGMLVVYGVLDWDTVLFGVAGLVPVMLGVFVGQSLRRRLPQEKFRYLILFVLILIGANLVRRGLLG